MATRKTPSTSARQAKPSIAVVVPCHREAHGIVDLLKRIGKDISHIFVVDDACSDNTGDEVERGLRDKRVVVIRHPSNKGVGAATLTGMHAAAAVGADVIVKLDGDGQMDPALIPEIVEPVLRGDADYAKGNRFHDPATLTEMPRHRLIGNVVLSFMSKASSGYWDVFDPTNGFVAISAEVFRKLPHERISERYFFESDMLHQLYLMRAVVTDVPMTAKYHGTGESGLSITQALFEFSAKHCKNLARRLFFTYVLRDFNIASLQLVLALPLIIFGVLFGFWHWIPNAAHGVETPAGTVMLAALPIILGAQSLLAFLQYDMANVPKRSPGDR